MPGQLFSRFHLLACILLDVLARVKLTPNIHRKGAKHAEKIKNQKIFATFAPLRFVLEFGLIAIQASGEHPSQFQHIGFPAFAFIRVCPRSSASKSFSVFSAVSCEQSPASFH
jgi:hypothetical protein